MSGFPILELPANPLPTAAEVAKDRETKRADAHLRSTQSVNGYHIEATDGKIGHVCDFMMDAECWAIRQLVVKTGHRFSGTEVLVPTTNVDRISYADSTVFVNLATAAVEQSPVHKLSAV